MRRKDRQMPEEFALGVIAKCSFAQVAMTDEKGNPYCVPLSVAEDGGSIYFHSAFEGTKTDILKRNPKVYVSCVGDVTSAADRFTTEFESAAFSGTACEVTDIQEKIKALRLICEKYTPDNMENFEDAIAKSLDRTAVWKIRIENLTGKRKKYDKSGEEMKFGRME